jgi:hypothetical protein
MVWLEVRVSRVAFFPTARFPEDGQKARGGVARLVPVFAEIDCPLNERFVS